APFLGIRAPRSAWCWLLVVLLGMELNVQHVEGGWVAGFRNQRHMHVFVYPLVLALTGYLVGLRARHPRVGHALLALLLAVSTWQSVETAWPTVVAFGDQRRAAQFLAGLPRKT